MSDLVFLPANQLAKAIRDRQVSSLEVLDAHLNQIATHNPKLNAIVTLDEEQARQRAKEADEALERGEIWGALHGVPITIKDSFETAGLRTTSSYQPLANYIPQQDATAVNRLRGAGAVILGKTNTPTLTGDYQTNSPLFGRTNNPWNLNCTPGGSTGGGAAALATGLSPLELGSDIGGSIRLPSHFCGVFGFKPTEHRVSTAGHIPAVPGMPHIRHMLTVGALARSLEDLRLCLSIIAGADSRQPYVPPVPLEAPQERSLSSYRFAWTDNFGGIPVTAETRTAVEKLAATLTDLGCRVEYCNPSDFDFNAAWEIYGEVVAFELGTSQRLSLDSIIQLLTYAFYDKFKITPITRGFWRSAGLSLKQYVRALTKRERCIWAMEQFFTSWDAWLCPVATVPAFTHRQQGKPIEVDAIKLPYLIGCGAYTTIFNLTGNPVVVLPVDRTKAGLPIGVQVVGRRWRDMELLNIAEKLAEVAGFFQRPPGY